MVYKRKAPTITIEVFEKLSADVKMLPKVRAAVESIMVEGLTWTKASKKFDVNESVIKYAIDRMNAPICECCGQRVKVKKTT